MIKKLALPIAFLAAPFFVGAQAANPNHFYSFIAFVRSVVDGLIPVVIGIAVLVFLWGLVKYVISKDDDAKTEAKGVMVYGIITLFVMVSVWGLVGFVQNLVGVGGAQAPQAPGLPQ